MAKTLLHHYTFSPSTDTIVFDGIYARERFLLITNATDEQQLYVFNDGYNGFVSVTFDYEAETTTVVLDYDCSAMSSTDKLQVFIEQDYQTFEPSPTYADPVSKFRVSAPQNLIDTDFEYGLQSTKWETLELVKNIPSFYSRNGDLSLTLASIASISGSVLITVTTSDEHNLSTGNPILVQGTTSITANGGYVVTKILSTTSFQYSAKEVQANTGSLLDTYTQVFVASVYQGTEFQLAGINGMTTDAANPSTLTVSTATPTNFSVGTSFFLSNSVGGKELSFDATDVNPSNVARAQAASTIDTATGEATTTFISSATVPGSTTEAGWQLGAVQPHNWRPYSGTYFIGGSTAAATISIDLATDVITLVGHGLVDGATYSYFAGYGNAVIGGLTDSRWYYAKVIDADNFSLSLTSGGANVNLTTTGTAYGVVRSCFARVYLPTFINTTSELVTMAEALPVTDSEDIVYLATYTTLGGATVFSSSAVLTNYVIGGGQALHATYSGSGFNYNFQATYGGANFNFTSATAAGAWMPVIQDPLANSVWFKSHGLSTDDTVWFMGTSTLPAGMGTTYYDVVNITDDRISFKNISTGADINFTSVGNSVAALKISETTRTLAVAPTGETAEDVGWQISAVCALNWLPDDAVWFRAGTTDQTVTVDTTAETITFDAAHGMEDNKPYAYYCGYGNSVIGGLTDGRWYFVRVVDSTTIYLTLTEGSTTRVNLTNSGVDVKVTRSAFVRGYLPTSVDTSAETMTFAEVIPGATAGGPQIYVAAYTTTGGLPIFGTSNSFISNVPGNGTTVYAKAVSGDGKTLRFSNQINGTTRNLNTGTIAGILLRVSVYPIANSIWYENHRFQTGDLARFGANTTVPPGLLVNDYYSLERVNDNRVRFQYYTSTTQVDISGYGAVGAAEYYITSDRQGTYAYDNDGDYIDKTAHGLSDGDVVAYDSNGGTEIDGLNTGSSYYVFNSKPNSFQLATTPTGYTGNSVTIAQTTGTMPYTYATFPTGHGFVTGDRLQYLSDSPLNGLRNGAFYYVNVSGNTIRFYLTTVEAELNWASGAVFGQPFSGTATFRKTTAVDLLATGTGTQLFNVTSPGASDGVYTIDSIVDSTTFTLASSGQIPDRVVEISPPSSVWIQENAIRVPDHYFVTGQDVLFNSATPIDPLVDATTYYVIRLSRNWIKLAATYDDALDGTAITLTDAPDVTQSLTTSSLTGELVGGGTVSIDEGSTILSGVATNFTSFFNTGDTISIYGPAEYDVKTVSSINDTTDVLTTSPAHDLTTEDMVEMDAGTAPTGTNNGQFYYVRVLTTTTLTLHPTPADALANTNIVNMTSTGASVTLRYYTSTGSTTTATANYVNSATTLQLSEASDVTLVGADFTVGTSLLVRADGFAIHRPYDGGVELIPSTNPDSQMIRQTRRYFRYQSGKGIQVSAAVNFQPSATIQSYTASGTTATITTRYPHRLSTGLSIVVSGATTSGANNYWNGTFAVASVVDEFEFTVTLLGTPSPDASSGPGGIPEFYVQSWDNSNMRVGLFDDQNGLFFEYDGSELSVVRRSATTQISGSATVNFRDGQIIGTNTRFTTQLAVGENIVIKGQTYLVTQIDSNNSLYVLPFYRGESQTNVVITKVINAKVPQSQWNIDKCDGTGPSGFYLRTYRIQMAYMDYSWYGAGKVRFGFKDQNGIVRYVHEFIHNNKQTEAYMRSGNLPARYEIQNIGTPTYVPALAHWGTSVIMDGGFDADNAYLFTASSNNVQLTGNATVAVTAVIETTQPYYVFINGAWRYLGYALNIETPSFVYNSLTRDLPISSTAGLTDITYTGVPNNTYGGALPFQPYQVSLTTRIGSDSTTENTRNLLIINRPPSATAASKVFTITVSATSVPVVYDVPLISIRLAPSVDTNTPGFLGQREIINRMQLILQQVGILSTHSAEITLRLNGLVSTNSWERVTNPSLSQLIYHTNQDAISGGVDIFTFRAQGGTGTSARTAQVTSQDLGEITTLGNSILGGNNTFPDGPDVLTIVAKLSEDPSTVSTTNPFNIVGRITWTESQA